MCIEKLCRSFFSLNRSRNKKQKSNFIRHFCPATNHHSNNNEFSTASFSVLKRKMGDATPNSEIFVMIGNICISPSFWSQLLPPQLDRWIRSGKSLPWIFQDKTSWAALNPSWWEFKASRWLGTEQNEGHGQIVSLNQVYGPTEESLKYLGTEEEECMLQLFLQLLFSQLGNS